MFGQRLRALRKRKKLSQVEVARPIRDCYGHPMSQANVSHLERRVDAPRQDMLNMLADFYGVPVLYFIQDDRAIDWPKRKAQIAAYLERLPERCLNSAPLLYPTEIPRQILEQVQRWQAIACLSED